MKKNVEKHKFISFDKSNKKYLVQIQEKDVKPYKNIFKKRFETLEEAIFERDSFMSKQKDKRYKGVTYNKANKNWNTFISFNGKSHYLSTHYSQEEAKDYRNEILKNLMNL